MVDLARRLSAVLGVDLEGARALLREWQLNEEDAQDKMGEVEKEKEKEKEKVKKEKRKALLPIWRCAVCGAADKPYIACYVSPYIVRYEECDV